MPMYHTSQSTSEEICVEAPDRELAACIRDALPTSHWTSLGTTVTMEEVDAVDAVADGNDTITYDAGDANVSDLIRQLESHGVAHRYQYCHQPGCTGILLRDLNDVSGNCIVCGRPATPMDGERPPLPVMLITATGLAQGLLNPDDSITVTAACATEGCTGQVPVHAVTSVPIAPCPQCGGHQVVQRVIGVITAPEDNASGSQESSSAMEPPASRRTQVYHVHLVVHDETADHYEWELVTAASQAEAEEAARARYRNVPNGAEVVHVTSA